MAFDEYAQIRSEILVKRKEIQEAEEDLKESLAILEEARRNTVKDEKLLKQAFKARDLSKFEKLKRRIAIEYPRLAVVPSKLKAAFAKLSLILSKEQEEEVDLNKFRH